MTLARALLGGGALTALSGESFVRDGVDPIPELWSPQIQPLGADISASRPARIAFLRRRGSDALATRARE